MEFAYRIPLDSGGRPCLNDDARRSVTAIWPGITRTKAANLDVRPDTPKFKSMPVLEDVCLSANKCPLNLLISVNTTRPQRFPRVTTSYTWRMDLVRSRKHLSCGLSIATACALWGVDATAALLAPGACCECPHAESPPTLATRPCAMAQARRRLLRAHGRFPATCAVHQLLEPSREHSGAARLPRATTSRWVGGHGEDL
eukprot:scaffold1541_cov256-Pinguiococcus_pyrenoidosus.AAC.9